MAQKVRKKTLSDYYFHSRRRAQQRYQMFLTLDDWERMNNLIRANEAFFLWRESNERTHWLIDDKYIVVYERKRSGIVTFLPPEAIYNYL